MKPSDYVLSGRYFQSIGMSEGEKLTKQVIEVVGEDILMYASDYLIARVGIQNRWKR